MMKASVLLVTLLLAFPAWAASPTVAARTQSATSPGDTSHSLDLPAGISAGETLICEFSASGQAGGGAPTVTWPGDWTSYFSGSVGGTSPIRLELAWHKATGSETSPITVTTNNAERSAHNCRRIAGAADPTINPPEAATAATGTSATPDPGTLTPGGGSKDYLWLATAGYGVVAGSCAPLVSVYPSGYSNGLEVLSGGGNDFEGRLASAEKQSTASSENPGTFTLVDDGGVPVPDCSVVGWVAVTSAVYPAGAGAGGATLFFRRRAQ